MGENNEEGSVKVPDTTCEHKVSGATTITNKKYELLIIPGKSLIIDSHVRFPEEAHSGRSNAIVK